MLESYQADMGASALFEPIQDILKYYMKTTLSTNIFIILDEFICDY